MLLLSVCRKGRKTTNSSERQEVIFYHSLCSKLTNDKVFSISLELIHAKVLAKGDDVPFLESRCGDNGKNHALLVNAVWDIVKMSTMADSTKVIAGDLLSAVSTERLEFLVSSFLEMNIIRWEFGIHMQLPFMSPNKRRKRKNLGFS